MSKVFVFNKTGDTWQVEWKEGEIVKTSHHSSKRKAVVNTLIHCLKGITKFYLVVPEDEEGT